MNVGSTRRGAGTRRAVAGVAVVADELDRARERADGAAAGGGTLRGPAEVVGEGAGRLVPGGLVDGFGGHEVERGAVAVRLVAGLAGSGDPQAVGAQDPKRVVEHAPVDRLGGASARHRPG